MLFPHGLAVTSALKLCRAEKHCYVRCKTWKTSHVLSGLSQQLLPALLQLQHNRLKLQRVAAKHAQGGIVQPVRLIFSSRCLPVFYVKRTLPPLGIVLATTSVFGLLSRTSQLSQHHKAVSCLDQPQVR
jgi:hypothetical protein